MSANKTLMMLGLISAMTMPVIPVREEVEILPVRKRLPNKPVVVSKPRLHGRKPNRAQRRAMTKE